MSEGAEAELQTQTGTSSGTCWGSLLRPGSRKVGTGVRSGPCRERSVGGGVCSGTGLTGLFLFAENL